MDKTEVSHAMLAMIRMGNDEARPNETQWTAEME